MTRPANPTLRIQIFTAAWNVVKQRGHHTLNMRDLAKQVGVTATTLYNYFENKEDLVFQLRLGAAEELNHRIDSIEGSITPHQFLHRLGEEYIGFAEDNPHLYKLLFEEMIGEHTISENENRLFYYTYYRARDALRSLAEDEQYPLNPRYGAMIGWIMLHGFCSLLISGTLEPAEGLTREELKGVFLSFYTHGGTRPESIETGDPGTGHPGTVHPVNDHHHPGKESK